MEVRNKTGGTLDFDAGWMGNYSPGPQVTGGQDHRVYLSIHNEQARLTIAEALKLAAQIEKAARLHHRMAMVEAACEVHGPDSMAVHDDGSATCGACVMERLR